MAVPAAADAAPEPSGVSTTEPMAMEQLVDSPLRRLPDYSNVSDHELTRLGAEWDDLNKDEKEALLREVKMRMAQRKDRDGVLMIRTQRRYGRVYGGGQYLKIETKVVRITPGSSATSGNPEGSAAGRGFGVGFEQRTAAVAEPAEDGAPAADGNVIPESPVVRVTEVTQ